MLAAARWERQSGREVRAPLERDNPGMGGRKKAKKDADPLAAYRRIRKPMPPPEKVVPDKRRKLEEEEAERELHESS